MFFAFSFHLLNEQFKAKAVEKLFPIL